MLDAAEIYGRIEPVLQVPANSTAQLKEDFRVHILAAFNSEPHPWKAASLLLTEKKGETAPANEPAPEVEMIRIAAVQAIGDILLEEDRLEWIERYDWCSTPEELQKFLTMVRIPNEQWRHSHWMRKKARLTPGEGGVNRNFSGFVDSIVKKFRQFRRFTAWMDGKDTPENTWKEDIATCAHPEDFILYFRKLGIKGDEWRSSNWMQKEARKTVNDGGIGLPLAGLVHEIRMRFQGFRKFVAWMDNKEEPEAYAKEMAALETPKAFLELFQKLGIPDERWRSSAWLSHEAILPVEQGGIGKGMSRFEHFILKRFKSHKGFTAWMDGKEYKGTLKKRVMECATPEDMRALFTKIGIPDEKWRSSDWLCVTAALPVEQGGIGKSFSGIWQYTKKRFGSYPAFIAWMDNKEMEETLMQRIMKPQTPDEMRALFLELGVPGENWKNFKWMQTLSRLPPDQGGIGKTFAGVHSALLRRFKRYRLFLHWMKGIVEKPQERFKDLIVDLQKPEEFLHFFRSIGIDGDNWRNSSWLCRTARLNKEDGGIDKNCAQLWKTLRNRFLSFDRFLAWMDGKESPDIKCKQRIAACTDRKDFLALFAEFELGEHVWRNSHKMQRLQTPAHVHGETGIHWSTLSVYIRDDARFGSYPSFVAWMDGYPLEGITSVAQARELLEKEAERMGITTDVLLDPERMSTHHRQSPLLRKIIEFFDTHQ